MAIFASIAASLDGFIRTESGDMAWLNGAMRRDEDYGMAETMQRVGAYVLGGGTRLFGELPQSQRLSLTECTSFKSGIVLLRYART